MISFKNLYEKYSSIFLEEKIWSYIQPRNLFQMTYQIHCSADYNKFLRIENISTQYWLNLKEFHFTSIMLNICNKLHSHLAVFKGNGFITVIYLYSPHNIVNNMDSI